MVLSWCSVSSFQFNFLFIFVVVANVFSSGTFFLSTIPFRFHSFHSAFNVFVVSSFFVFACWLAWFPLFGLVWLGLVGNSFCSHSFFSSVCEIISDTEWMWVFMYIYIKRVQEIRVLFYLSPRYTMYIFVGAVGFFFFFLSLAHSQSVYLIRPKNTREWMS